MVHSALAGNFKTASSHLYNFIEVNNLMYTESNPVGAKVALELLGVSGREVRLPLIKGSEKLIQEIKVAMP